MPRHGPTILFTTLIAGLFIGGCSSGSPGPDRLATAYQELAAREMSHHQASLEQQDPQVIHAETDDYCDEMDVNVEEMLAACDEMMGGGGGMMGGGMMGGGMGGGMMSDEDADQLRETMAHMDRELAEHCDAADETDELHDMQDECTEHHEEMLLLLDELDETVPTSIDMDCEDCC